MSKISKIRRELLEGNLENAKNVDNNILKGILYKTWGKDKTWDGEVLKVVRESGDKELQNKVFAILNADEQKEVYFRERFSFQRDTGIRFMLESDFEEEQVKKILNLELPYADLFNPFIFINPINIEYFKEVVERNVKIICPFEMNDKIMEAYIEEFNRGLRWSSRTREEKELAINTMKELFKYCKYA